MVEDRERPKPGKDRSASESYLASLVQIIEQMDFAATRRAVQALGEAAESAAIKPLVAVVKGCAALRAAAVAALKKISAEDEAAGVELAIAVMEERGESPTAERAAGVVPLADRRRSPRVLLEIAVLVRWQDEQGAAHGEATTTEIVNACGALLILKTPVKVGLDLEITNVTTQAATQARVVWIGSFVPGQGTEVGIELDTADPEFWVGSAAS